MPQAESIYLVTCWSAVSCAPHSLSMCHISESRRIRKHSVAVLLPGYETYFTYSEQNSADLDSYSSLKESFNYLAPRGTVGWKHSSRLTRLLPSSAVAKDCDSFSSLTRALLTSILADLESVPGHGPALRTALSYSLILSRRQDFESDVQHQRLSAVEIVSFPLPKVDQSTYHQSSLRAGLNHPKELIKLLAILRRGHIIVHQDNGHINRRIVGVLKRIDTLTRYRYYSSIARGRSDGYTYIQTSLTSQKIDRRSSGRLMQCHAGLAR